MGSMSECCGSWTPQCLGFWLRETWSRVRLGSIFMFKDFSCSGVASVLFCVLGVKQYLTCIRVT